MKIWVLSDLHLGHADMDLRSPEADVCVVAGDVTDPVLGSMRWLGARIAKQMPVVFVAGNHEFYGDSVQRGRALARQHPVEGVLFLNDTGVFLDGVRFLGTTLWTDYELYAAGMDERAADLETAGAMAVADRLLTDHYTVRTGPEGGPYRRWTPSDARAAHKRSRAWLEAALAIPHDGPTVVVSHHAPHPRSVSPGYEESTLNPAFTSDLSAVIEAGRPDLWVHGHVHSSHDYRVGSTRIVCNPRGYLQQGYPENRAFDPRLVIELAQDDEGETLD